MLVIAAARYSYKIDRNLAKEKGCQCLTELQTAGAPMERTPSLRKAGNSRNASTKESNEPDAVENVRCTTGDVIGLCVEIGTAVENRGSGDDDNIAPHSGELFNPLGLTLRFGGILIGVGGRAIPGGSVFGIRNDICGGEENLLLLSEKNKRYDRRAGAGKQRYGEEGSAE